MDRNNNNNFVLIVCIGIGNDWEDKKQPINKNAQQLCMRH